MKLRLLLLLLVFPTIITSAGVTGSRASLNIRIVTDESEAVLAVLEKRAAGTPITEDDWTHIFQSEGYQRLKKRELSMSRPFDDAEFRKFVMSPELFARREALAATLAKWRSIDPASAGAKALAYLPRKATIAAKIYPVIKPRENSFVFEVKTDPAIFLYLDPAVDADKFENMLTHLVAHVCGLEVGDFIHTFGDLHIYSNHLDQVDELLSREPLPLPTLQFDKADHLKGFDGLLNFKFENLKLDNYQSHGKIAAPVAV